MWRAISRASGPRRFFTGTYGSDVAIDRAARSDAHETYGASRTTRPSRRDRDIISAAIHVAYTDASRECSIKTSAVAGHRGASRWMRARVHHPSSAFRPVTAFAFPPGGHRHRRLYYLPLDLFRGAGIGEEFRENRDFIGRSRSALATSVCHRCRFSNGTSSTFRVRDGIAAVKGREEGGRRRGMILLYMPGGATLSRTSPIPHFPSRLQWFPFTHDRVSYEGVAQWFVCVCACACIRYSAITDMSIPKDNREITEDLSGQNLSRTIRFDRRASTRDVRRDLSTESVFDLNARARTSLR